jgi:hypothetical protein
VDAEYVGTGIPLYRSACALAAVGRATMPCEKFEAGIEMVVVWWMVFSAVTLHAPVVPAGQSTVKVLFILSSGNLPLVAR